MLIEARLTKLIGPLGGKLHTGRSRNDQVALDLKLYLLDETAAIIELLEGLKATFALLAEKKYRRDHAGLHAPSTRPASTLLAPYAQLL